MIEKLPNNKYPEQWTFEDCIDNRISINELIEAHNKLEQFIKTNGLPKGIARNIVADSSKGDL